MADFLHVEVNLDGMKKLARDNRGRFSSSQGAVYRVNDQAARDFQNMATTRLRRTLVRPNVSTGRMLKAYGAEGNRKVSSSGWGVGIYDFLDTHVNRQGFPYWRAVEEGFVFDTTRMLGYWTDRGGTVRAPFGRGRGQRFVPFKGRGATSGRTIGYVRGKDTWGNVAGRFNWKARSARYAEAVFRELY